MYVFQKEDGSYWMCTKLPNWDLPEINIGQKGFVTTESYVAGEEYYDRDSDTYKKIRFTNVYLKNFIEIPKNKEIIL